MTINATMVHPTHTCMNSESCCNSSAPSSASRSSAAHQGGPTSQGAPPADKRRLHAVQDDRRHYRVQPIATPVRQQLHLRHADKALRRVNIFRLENPDPGALSAVSRLPNTVAHCRIVGSWQPSRSGEVDSFCSHPWTVSNTPWPTPHFTPKASSPYRPELYREE